MAVFIAGTLQANKKTCNGRVAGLGNLWHRPGDGLGFAITVFFYCVYHTAGGGGAAFFICDRITGGILVWKGDRPPQVCAVLADEQVELVAPVFIFGHRNLTPADGDFFAVPRGGDFIGRALQIDTRHGQFDFAEEYKGSIHNNIHNAGRDPAKIVQFVEFDIQPLAVLEPSAHRADIAGIQVGGVQVCFRWPVAAMRLHFDRHRREGVGGGGARCGGLGDSR